LPQERQIDVLDWPRTIRDPFEGEWEHLLAEVLAHPERRSGDLFQELQRQSPGRYQPSQLGTLQRGIRKIRAHLLHIREEPRLPEVIQAPILISIEPQEAEGGASQEQQLPVMGEAAGFSCETAIAVADELRDEENQEAQSYPLTMTIERAIQAYLQEQRDHGYSRKTLEWHETALRLVQQYLVNHCHLRFLNQITEKEVCGWFASLRTPSSLTGNPRKTSTIATYGRSLRAFCHWAVRKGYVQQTPLVRGILPKAEKKRIQVIEPEAFDRLLVACRPAGERAVILDRVAARNRSILWILMDTGMRVSELCGLRLSDVNREQRSLRIQGRGEERWLTLSANGWFQVLSYLESHHLTEGCSQEKQAQEAPLFLSETYQPLTINALTLLFGRLRKRAGRTEEQVTPSLLRDTFAVRYLQAGGEPEALRAILGLTGMESVKRYEQISTQKIEDEPQKEPAEQHRSEAMVVPPKSKQRRRKPSSVATRSQQQEADRIHRAGKKKPFADAGEDP
jgi:site-specific recombinase XerD